MVTTLKAASAGIVLLLLPAVAFAAEPNTTAGIGGAVTKISGIVDSLIPILLTIAVVIFLWGLIKYLFKVGGEEGSKGGLQIMLWGVVALFVMVSIWGLVKLLQNTLNVDPESSRGVADPSKIQITGGAAVNQGDED